METWKVIETESEYKEALERTITIFHAKPNSLEFEELESLLILVKDYENKSIIIPKLK